MSKKVAALLLAFTLSGCEASLEQEVRSKLKAPELAELRDLRRSKDGNHICGMIQTRTLTNQVSVPWTRFSTVNDTVQIVHGIEPTLFYAEEYMQRCF